MHKLTSKFKNSRSIIELMRYGLIGIFSNSVAYSIYLLITYAGVAPKITMSLLYATGAAIGFVGNRRWTFSHQGDLVGAGVRYLIVHGLGYFANLTILIVMVDHLGYPHQWAQALAIILVACFLFLAFKFFVFRVPRQS